MDVRVLEQIAKNLLVCCDKTINIVLAGLNAEQADIVRRHMFKLSDEKPPT